MIVSIAIGSIGIAMVCVAVWHERRMQRHRQPGVTYRQVTLRRDGGWRRADLFTDEGLKHQRRASAWGFFGLALLLVATVIWILSRR